MRKTLLIIISIIALFVGSSQAKAPSEVDIHGFISQGYLKSDKNRLWFTDTDDGSFQFNEMGINFMTNISDGLQLGMQFFARDMGSLGNDEVMVDWAYADYFYRKWLGIRAGKLKMYHGLYNDTRDIDMLRVSILLPQCAYMEQVRDVFAGIKGVGIYGELPGGFSYQLSTGIFQISDDSAFNFITSGYIQSVVCLINWQSVNPISELNPENLLNASLIWEMPIDGLRLGSTKTLADLEAVGSSFDVDLNFDVSTLSVEYILGSLTLAAEYAEHKLTATSSGNPDVVLKIGGYHTSAAYTFTEWLELGIYYSVLYYDMDEKEDIGDELYLKQTAVSLKFNINEHWTLKLEGHSMNGYYFADSVDDSAHKNWPLYAIKLTFSF